MNNDKQYDKIDLLNWNISSSYNFEADSMNLSPIRSSIRTTLPGGFKLDISMTHDLYKLELNQANTILTRINKIGYPRVTNVSGGTSMRLSGKRILSFIVDDNIEDTSQTKIDSIYTQSGPLVGKNNFWEASLSFRYSLNQLISGYQIIDNKTFWSCVCYLIPYIDVIM